MTDPKTKTDAEDAKPGTGTQSKADPAKTDRKADAKPNAKASAGPKPTQAAPTAPPKRDPKTGRQLDEHGLPVSGPARAKALNGKPDPAIETTANAADNGNEKDMKDG